MLQFTAVWTPSCLKSGVFQYLCCVFYSSCQGLGVLSVALGLHAVQLLHKLFDDLQTEGVMPSLSGTSQSTSMQVSINSFGFLLVRICPVFYCNGILIQIVYKTWNQYRVYNRHIFYPLLCGERFSHCPSVFLSVPSVWSHN